LLPVSCVAFASKRAIAQAPPISTAGGRAHMFQRCARPLHLDKSAWTPSWMCKSYGELAIASETKLMLAS
ncbi:hypothetical protein AB1J03_24085, partial [Vibrio diabolicus]|uniref:hypothetical protein n=1 Tax=Vibrio diabolicus TaxID=50719 RepID=UPI0034579F70